MVLTEKKKESADIWGNGVIRVKGLKAVATERWLTVPISLLGSKSLGFFSSHSLKTIMFFFDIIPYFYLIFLS